jgi:putative copper export protein/methionine-rich copper-binding protein CopC
MRNRSRQALYGILFSTLAVIATPALLFAHAHLLRSTPGANATLSAPPTSLSLWFSERPEVKFTTLQLLDSAGAAITLGEVTRLDGGANGLTAKISTTLAAGKYTVVWKTAAEDGHASNGKFSFVVTGSAATPSTAPPATNVPAVAPSIVITPKPASNDVVQSMHATTYSTAMRWAELVGLLSLIGCAFYRLLILERAGWSDAQVADSADRARRLAGATLLLFSIATLARLVAQSDLVPNASVARVDAILTTMRDTRWGHGWVIGAVGALVAFVTLHFSKKGLSGWAATGIAVVAMCLSESLTGHAGAIPNRAALAVAADVAHVLGAGGWLGGLLAVVLCGMGSLRKLNDAQRPLEGSKLVRSFHRAALECVAIVVLSAVIAVPLRLNAVSDLWRSNYGQWLLRKSVFVVIALGFGFYHWKTAVSREWTANTDGAFRKSALGELLVGGVIIAITAILIGTAMPSS